MNGTDLIARHASRGGLLCLAAVACLFAAPPGAIASPAAIDQYTEQPPSGPGGSGSSTDLNAGGQTQPTHHPAPSGTAPAPPSAPSSDPAPAVPPTEQPVSRPDNDQAANGGDKPAQVRHRAKESAAPDHHTSVVPVAAQTHDGAGIDEDSGGYPMTTFVLIVLLLAAVAVAGRLAFPAVRRLIANGGRRRGPEGPSPPRSHPLGGGDPE